MTAPTGPPEQAPASPLPIPLAPLGEAASLAGRTIDRYTLEALIGRGGMGEVYRAVDTRLRRKVALKVLRTDKSGERPDAVERLFREARAAAALTHPNAVAIHDLGERDGLFYIVMELVSGVPLLAYVGDDRAPLGRKLRWCADVARALASAHKAGVLHRDVKPSNVMISEDGVAKVLDFGLAKPVEPMSIDFRTQKGRVVGTVRYMAPEQLAGGEADQRCDQYALGVTAFELFAGRPPGGSAVPIREQLATLVPALPLDGARIVERMMRRSPGERFPSMNDVATALEDVAGGRPVRVSLPAIEAASTPERTRSAPSIPDTVREDGLGGTTPSDVTETVDPPPVGASASPLALDKTIPGSLVARQAAHARAHEAARTLLSREVPSGLHRMLKANDLGSKTANMAEAPKLPTAPPTLVSGTAVAPPAQTSAPPAQTSAPPAQASAPPAQATARLASPTRSATPSQPKTAPPRANAPLILFAIVVVAAALATGVYLGLHVHDPTTAPPAPTGQAQDVR